MFANGHRKYALLLGLLLLGVPAVLLAPSAGDASDRKAPSARLIDTSPSEPPRQHDDWTAPSSTVPTKFVTAVRLLFDQGFADPRGGEYREIEVRTDGGVAPTHGWVLPARPGDERRYAVCWNGLVYALLSCGKKADLADDVRGAITRITDARERPEPGWRPLGHEARDVWHKTLGYYSSGLATALLLRLGEGELASAWWNVHHPPTEDQHDNQMLVHSYLSLLHQFARVWCERFVAAVQRGDDTLALSDARRLAAFSKVAFAEAKACMLNREAAQPADIEFLKLLPVLLADQERRATAGPRPAVVCMGPGREPDARRRIAALIERLEETDDNEEVKHALVREGLPAVEPLLKCYAEDARLTREVSLNGSKPEYVRDEAFTAVRRILARELLVGRDFWVAAAPLTVSQQLPLIRDVLSKAQRVSPAERAFNLLADDNASKWDWRMAGQTLLSPSSDRPRRSVWSARPAADKPTVLGEPLRGKTNPSVTELLLRRIDQCESEAPDRLFEALSQWEPQAARGPLARQMKRPRPMEEWHAYVHCVNSRCQLGDRKALDDYLAWTATATPKVLDGSALCPFEPIQRYPDHPGMAAAAAVLFDSEQSPWLPLIGNSHNPRVRDLIATDLLRLPAFRKSVLKELDNKHGMGTVHARPSGMMDAGEFRAGGHSEWWRELDIPEEGSKGPFRVCDYVAWAIGEHVAAAPRCELYWSEQKRDTAVAACAAFLRQYGDHLFRDPNCLKCDRPATADDVRGGQAVFSLAGQGETRVIRGLGPNLPARWVTLKNRPYETVETNWQTGDTFLVTKDRQDGRIVQAEEVLKGDKWQRFYGFVGSNRVARVAAEEIEFPPPEPTGDEPHVWVRVGPGWHARLEVPPLKVELIDGYAPRLPTDADLTFGLVMRNSRGVEQPAPALDKSVHLRLLYSPETVSRQGALVPQATRDAEWTELKPKVGAAFQVEKGKPLAVVEERKLATFDLRKWFGVSKPGFYRLQLLPAAQEPGAVPEVSEVRFSLAPAAR